MDHSAKLPPITSRKVRVWPGLRLEICGKDASAQLTPDEALGLANSIVLHAREAIYQEAAHRAAALGVPGPSLSARSAIDCATVSIWHDGIELIATLNRVQAEALARVLKSKVGSVHMTGNIQRFTPSAS